MKSCKEWLDNHKHGKEYLEILLAAGSIKPAQADWLIKKFIIDETKKVYNTDINPDDCGFDIWADTKAIVGYYN